MRAKILTVALLALMLSGCTSNGKAPEAAPTPRPSDPEQTPVASAPPGTVASALAQASSGSTVDLGLAIAGDCLMSRGNSNTLWLRVNVAVNWIGSKFPETTYSLAADRGASPVTGVVQERRSLRRLDQRQPGRLPRAQRGPDRDRGSGQQGPRVQRGE